MFAADYQTVLTFHRDKTVDGAQLWCLLDYMPAGSGTGAYEGTYQFSGKLLEMEMTFTADSGAVSVEEWTFALDRENGETVLTLRSADGPVRTRQGEAYRLTEYP